MRTPAEKFESDNLNIHMHKHVARGVRGVRTSPPHSRKGPQNLRTIYALCMWAMTMSREAACTYVHVGSLAEPWLLPVQK